MREYVHWIDAPLPSGRVAVMPHPHGGDWLDSEIQGLVQQKVDIVVSLLGEDEALALGLEQEGTVCRSYGIELVSYPIRDRSVPRSTEEVHELLRRLRAELEQGRAIVFHCWAGIGRSSLMAASLLVLSGLSADEAFERITEARGLHVPDTQQQREWVERFAQRLSA